MSCSQPHPEHSKYWKTSRKPNIISLTWWIVPSPFSQILQLATCIVIWWVYENPCL